MVIGSILAVILVVALIRRFIKLILTMAVVLIAFVGYLHFTGREVPTTAEELNEAVSMQIEKAKDSASGVVDEALQAAKEEIADQLTGENSL